MRSSRRRKLLGSRGGEDYTRGFKSLRQLDILRLLIRWPVAREEKKFDHHPQDAAWVQC